MKTLFRSLLPVVLPLLPLSLAQGALNPSIVPADARWLVYLDLNALRSGGLGQEITAALTQMQPPAGDGGIRLDYQKVLATAGSITAYGTTFSRDAHEVDGVLVVQGTAELRSIVEGYLAQATITSPDTVTEFKELPFSAYSISGQVIIALPPKEPVVLVGKSKEHILKALELVRGSGASLAKTTSPLSALLPKTKTYYLIASTVVPDTGDLFPQNQPQARILQLASAGSIALGEDGATTALRAQLVASSGETADKLMRIVQGITAMISLTQSNDQRLTEFMKSVTVERSGDTVNLNMSYPTDRLVQMIQTIHNNHRNDGDDRGQNGGRNKPFPAPEEGTVVASWVADQQLGGDAPTPQNIVSRTIENVQLKRGTTITVSGRRDQGEHARIDYVDITPATGGEPERFEAEYMRLSNYRVEEVPFASGGELIMLTNSPGTAQLKFGGADGSYTLKVGYVDESDGKSSLAVSVKYPETATPAAKSAK